MWKGTGANTKFPLFIRPLWGLPPLCSVVYCPAEGSEPPRLRTAGVRLCRSQPITGITGIFGLGAERDTFLRQQVACPSLSVRDGVHVEGSRGGIAWEILHGLTFFPRVRREPGPRAERGLFLPVSEVVPVVGANMCDSYGLSGL